MFGKGIKLFTLFGFEVKMDPTWLILALLITWTLADGLFPNFYHDLSTATFWWMGVAGALGLFLSVVFHELSHSLVARRYGIPMKGITLFIFGGVAEMHEEAKSARSEFMMAIAGPVSSVIFGGVLLLIYYLVGTERWPEPVQGVFIYLGVINLFLAVFNMIPAFPLDGGRVLRAILWNWHNDLRRATRTSSKIGSAFGIVLIVLGALSFVSGNFINGVWLFLIGLFLRHISQNAYKQLLMRRALEGEAVSRFMHDKPITVPPSATISKLVDDYIYAHHFKFFPVSDDSTLVGCVTLERVKSVPREEWDRKTVREISEDCSEENTITPDTDAVTALSTMSRTGRSRLMVVENGKLKGIIALKDLLSFLSMKIDLEEAN
jgi:Zn-dependent protease/CBS domain-containing protein